jgi:hypothetical protein
MFVGYPPNHAGEVCQFLNLQTKRIINSRTAMILHKTYGEYYKMAQNLISNVPNIEEEGITIEDIKDTEHFQNLVQDIPDDLSTIANSEDF